MPEANRHAIDTDIARAYAYGNFMYGAESYTDDFDRRFLLSRDSRLPLWQQIAEILEKEIHQGRYVVGDRLPAEGELPQWFGVNRHTVRRAISTLQERGLVKTERGRGSFVYEGVVDYSVSRRTRFSEILNRQNRSPHGILLGSKTQEADTEISEALQIPTTHLVTILHILREGDGRPLSLSTHSFPVPRFAGIAETFQKTGSVTDCLRTHGVPDFFRDETRVVARPSTTEEARQLGLSKNRPILETKSINVDEYGVPVDYGVARYAADKVQLVIKSQ